MFIESAPGSCNVSGREFESQRWKLDGFLPHNLLIGVSPLNWQSCFIIQTPGFRGKQTNKQRQIGCFYLLLFYFKVYSKTIWMFVPAVRLTTRQIQIGISGYDLQLFTLNFLKPFLTWTPTLSFSHTITTLYLSLSPSLADTIPLSHTHSTSLSVNPTAANLRESYSS